MNEGDRLALIVACDRYSDPKLKELKAPSQDAERFARILENPKIGGFKVTSLINQPHDTITTKINKLLQSCTNKDTVLLYFSCHGIKDTDSQLYFATITTDKTLLPATAIESNFVNRLLEHCKAQQKVLLLDCCYSGAFEKGRVVKADTQINVTTYFGRGSVVITASDEIQYAFEGDDRAESLGKVGSYFTNALIEGLESGKADVNNDGKITYSELYNYVYDHIKRITPDQTPTLNARGLEGDFVIFNNIRDNLSSEDPEPPAAAALTEKTVRHHVNDPILGFIEEARRYLEQEQYDKANKKFDGILTLREGHIEALNGKGVALCKQKKFKEALECFKEVLKIRPTHTDASVYVEMITDRIDKERSGEVKGSRKVIEQNTAAAALEKRTEEKVKKALADSTQIPSELIMKGDGYLEKGCNTLL